MFAVISDIHSNLEALTAVLADIEKRGIRTIYCLGDVIGYG
jgi:predicted phosphodiesterase